MNRKTMLAALGSAVLMLALIVSVMVQSPAPVTGAPAAAITPVAAKDPVGASDARLVRFYDAEQLTADDQNCIDLMEYRVIDLEYVVDQTLVASANNTTTVNLEHTNGAGSTLAVNTTGQVVVSANAADADDLNRFDLFGRYTCVDINLTSANPVTWTVIGIARK